MRLWVKPSSAHRRSHSPASCGATANLSSPNERSPCGRPRWPGSASVPAHYSTVRKPTACGQTVPATRPCYSPESSISKENHGPARARGDSRNATSRPTSKPPKTNGGQRWQPRTRNSVARRRPPPPQVRRCSPAPSGRIRGGPRRSRDS